MDYVKGDEKGLAVIKISNKLTYLWVLNGCKKVLRDEVFTLKVGVIKNRRENAESDVVRWWSSVVRDLSILSLVARLKTVFGLTGEKIYCGCFLLRINFRSRCVWIYHGMDSIALPHPWSHRVKSYPELHVIKTDVIASYFPRTPRLFL